MGESASSVKIVVQSTAPVSSSQAPVYGHKSAVVISPARIEQEPSSVKSPANKSPVKSPAMQKPAPNPANVDAAIAAVACDVDGPVCVSSNKAPRKVVPLNPSPDVQEVFKSEESKPFIPKKKNRKDAIIATTVEPVQEQDVDICGANEDVVNEIEVSENDDLPRFVLSQDNCRGEILSQIVLDTRLLSCSVSNMSQ